MWNITCHANKLEVYWLPKKEDLYCSELLNPVSTYLVSTFCPLIWAVLLPIVFHLFLYWLWSPLCLYTLQVLYKWNNKSSYFFLSDYILLTLQKAYGVLLCACLLDVRKCIVIIITYLPHHSLTCHQQSCCRNPEADSMCLLGWTACGAPIKKEAQGLK